ncbi:GDSL-type esterase/lipase family protein [Serratia liquefaciens]|uniref:GDSL-type esterase/lipase family protein n=1 Tax=Serratia liquefaciens TaxID=614 RepID=UPI0038027F06
MKEFIMRMNMLKINVKLVMAASIIALSLFNYCKADASVKSSPEYLKLKEMYSQHPGHFKYIMFGDSITKSGKWNDLLPGYSIGNRGISGDDTSGMLDRTVDIERTGAKTVFIMAGTNDISRNITPRDVARNIISISNRLKADGINVVIQSTILSGESKAGKNPSINTINNLLKSYSIKSGTTFLDLNTKLSENGLLKSEYTYDGTHLTDKGYEVWKGILLDFLKSSGQH